MSPVGFFNFSFDNIPDLELPDKVGTFTFTPGIQFNYQYTDNLSFRELIWILDFRETLTTDKRCISVFRGNLSSSYHS